MIYELKTMLFETGDDSTTAKSSTKDKSKKKKSGTQ